MTSLEKRIVFLNFSIGDLEDAIRKQFDKQILEIALARVVARIFCLAEAFYSLPLVEMMSQKYPTEHCSYCQKSPCQCLERRPASILQKTSERQQSWSLRQWCNHLNNLYGQKNKEKGIENLLNRLFKEISELLSLALLVHSSHKTPAEIEKEFALELADALAWTIAIANFLGINLQQAVLKRYYENNCWNCHQNPCVCSHPNLEPVNWEKIQKSLQEG